MGEIYAANKRYEESKEIFLLAYHRAPIGKNILYRLIEVSLKMGQISEATEFFDEYREVAGNDNSQYILKYKIARAKNASLNEQIRILRNIRRRNLRSAGPMSWPSSITRQETSRSAWISAMR